MPITAADATASAQANVPGLTHHPTWIPGFHGVTPDPAPWRVRLPEVAASETPYYFIVTFRRGKTATARMAIHADTGAIREMRAIQNAASHLIEFVDPLSVLLPIGGAVSPPIVEPDLFWRPCRASTSMLDPFFVAVIAGRKLFVRVDGQVFHDLAVIGHG